MHAYRRIGLALLALVAIAAVIMTASSSGEDDESPSEAAAARAAAMVPGALGERPRDAALLALASQRLSPSADGELAMLAVAGDHMGVERVIHAHPGEVSAAIASGGMVVTAGEGTLRTWRASDGAAVGELRTPRPIVALGDGETTSLLVAADAAGRLSLVDMTDPRRPSLRPVGRTRAETGRARLLDLALSAQGLDVVAVHSDGTIQHVDTATGERSRSATLHDYRGDLPWGDDRIELTAAQINTDTYAIDGTLLVATEDGAVASLDMATGKGKTLIGPGVAPGRVVSIAAETYTESGFVAATAGGFVQLHEDEDEPTVERGPPLTGVAFAGEQLWTGDGQGARLREADFTLPVLDAPPGGRPVAELSQGAGGVVAIHPGGAVSVLGERDAGLTLAETITTPLASFGTGGGLLVAEGYDANHIDRLFTMRPGPESPETDGGTSPHEELQSFRPARDWWPDADDGSGLYVNDAVIDDELLAVGGQDPTGTAVVLVWDARSGRPLRRLPLATGGVETDDPSIVTSLVSIPGKDRIAAYSAVQELVAIWSTETWEQVAAVPVGAAGDMSLSPDESTLMVVGVDVESDEGSESDDASQLSFVDVDDGEVRDRVATRDVHRAAWSPSGDSIAALAGDGTLRMLSADGGEQLLDPVDLEGGLPLALVWRPDGRMIAVALEEGGIVLVDPATGAVSSQLPGSGANTFDLSWSPDGNLLASTTSTADGDSFDPGPAQIWTVGAAALEARLCELAGGPATPSEWRRLVGGDVPPQRLCAARRAGEQAGERRRSGSPVVAFRRGNELHVADVAGRSTPIGRVATDSYVPVTFAWSGDALAWLSSGQLHLLPSGDEPSEWWPCACSGVTWHAGEVVALASDGRALHGFGPGRPRPRQVPIDGSVGVNPHLIGFVGDKAIVSGFEGEPDRASPSVLFTVDSRGKAERLPGEVRGAIAPDRTASTGDAVAFVAISSSGACYSPAVIGVLAPDRAGRLRTTYPELPPIDDIHNVRALGARADGTIEAAIAPIGCVDGMSSDEVPDAELYELEGADLEATGERAYLIQGIDDGFAVVRDTTPSRLAGELVLRSADGEVTPVARGVDQVSARP